MRADPPGPVPSGEAHAAGEGGRPLRVCLDLNVWAANLLARERGRTGTAARACVLAMRGRGEETALGSLRLVVSWGMLTRLGTVLERKLGRSPPATQAYLAQIAALARVSSPGAPLVVLGGTGVMPVRDAEDAHVVDVAIAGRAEVIVTGNFADFVSYRTEVVEPGRVAMIEHAAGRVVIAHPAEFAGWVRGGGVPAGVLTGGN